MRLNLYGCCLLQVYELLIARMLIYRFVVTGKEGPVARALFDLILEDMMAGPPMVRLAIPY